MKARRGVTYLEYALLAALVGIVGAVGLKYYGERIKSLFQALGDKTAEVTPATKK
jgi:Flp pilus assembly pilin Flp